ncbi:Rho GTPase activation protein [Mucor mucedo]|uniref:Rho GTPase activation protein n=1 Tax=Mucor mucedo TaxID=29922 RepID=UPI00222115F5|nr:Rho GTPase activation protein [Mucor mucedo]KAI7894577.1 Rho GTPase activation protein [Mucor mucedo]
MSSRQSTVALQHDDSLSENDSKAVAGITSRQKKIRIRLHKVQQTKNDGRWVDKMRKPSSIIQLEQTLHDGVVLAKLARRIQPSSITSIISGDAKFKFLRSNNINAFLSVIQQVATQRNLEKSGVPMPNFNNLGASLQNELDGGKKKTFLFRPIEEPLIDDEDLMPKMRQIRRHTPDLIVADLYDSDTESKTSASDDHDTSSGITTMQRLQFLDASGDSSISSSASEIEYYDDSDELDSEDEDAIAARATALEQHFNCSRKQQIFACPDDWVTALQAMIRRHLAIKKMDGMHQFQLVENQRIENLRIEGKSSAQYHESAYQKLKSDKNPSIGVVKSVLHMLSNNDVDFNEDLIIEDLRQKVIESIRENNHLDSQVSMIDIQIALLLKNVVTLDEVVKLSNAFFNPNRRKQQQQRFSQLMSSNPSNSPYDLRGVDKGNRDKLELYQQLVFLLQTEPVYLARLMSITGGQVYGEKKGQRKIDATVLALFGYGTNAREECLLINLCRACIVQEMKRVKDPQEFMRGNYTFMKLVVQVNRGAKERQFFTSLFEALIKKVIENNELDLETNPVVIYQKFVGQEESRTGNPSDKPFHINHSQALQVPEDFLSAIIKTVDSMPYGMRVIARELRLVMEENFPDEASEEIIKFWEIFPAITAPEQYVSLNHEVSSVQRKNLAEVSKMLQQISIGKDFDTRNVELSALNSYIRSSNQRFTQWFMDRNYDVEEPEQHFGLDQLSDYKTQKPTIYVHPTELYHIHQLLEENIDSLERQKTGILHNILGDLGEAPVDVNMSVPLHVLRLELSDRRDGIPNEAVQSGPSLEAIFEDPVTDEHESIWEIVREQQFPSEGTEKEIEMAIRERNFKFGYQNAAMDVKSLSFAKLKSFASKLHAYLLQHSVIPPSPGYQSIINMIAVDITKKGERRKLRNAEIKKLQNILLHLDEKRQFLIGQANSYKKYLDGCMNNMAERRGKKQKFVFPFTKQYFHMKYLKSHGLVPKFGSFKYSAKTLYDRGIILDLSGVSKKLYARITLILSMDRAGIITFEGYFPLMNTQELRVDVQYEELLQTQYECVQTMKVLDGMATVNVNLLIYLINKSKLL